MFQGFGKTLVVFGLIIVAVGVFVSFFDKIPFLGKLPGDIYIKKGNFNFYAPITSAILVSIVISVLLTIFFNIKK